MEKFSALPALQSDTELWCFLWGTPEQAVIEDAMTLIVFSYYR